MRRSVFRIEYSILEWSCGVNCGCRILCWCVDEASTAVPSCGVAPLRSDEFNEVENSGGEPASKEEEKLWLPEGFNSGVESTRLARNEASEDVAGVAGVRLTGTGGKVNEMGVLSDGVPGGNKLIGAANELGGNSGEATLPSVRFGSGVPGKAGSGASRLGASVMEVEGSVGGIADIPIIELRDACCVGSESIR